MKGSLSPISFRNSLENMPRCAIKWRPRRIRKPEAKRLYVLVLIELQSTCPEDMALRVLTYVLLFYQRLCKDQPLGKGDRLPVILPFILYNGDDPWDSPLDVFDLIDVVPESLAPHIPSMRCILIDEKRCRPEDLAALDENVMAAICRVEQSTSTSLGAVVRDLLEWLGGRKDRELCRDLLAWLAKVVVPLRCPEADIPELRDLRDLLTYVETDMPNWIEEAKAEGRQAGQAELVLRLIEHKFSPVPEAVKARILSADIDELVLWTDRILTARSLADVFRDEETDAETN